MFTSISKRAYAAIAFVLTAILLISLLSADGSAHPWKSPTPGGPQSLGNSRSHRYDRHGSDSPGGKFLAVPAWNQPPEQHVPEATPLFIGFTRNWPVLKQAVVSYIAAGWPASDIYIVDNTGTMASNAISALSPENPFYFDHGCLNLDLNVNILTAPTYLSFAQLQNYFLYTAISRHWPHYFWSHMDVAALSDEARRPDAYASLYSGAVQALRDTSTDAAWGIRFFAYDHLTLANTAAYAAVGGFDTFIPYYQSDCDFYFRLTQAGYTIGDVEAGFVYDVGESLPDLTLFSRANTTSCSPEDISAAANATTATEAAPGGGRGDCRFHALQRMLKDLDHRKQTHEGGRNFWQAVQKGGQGEPYWQWPDGFERALQMQSEHGKVVFEEKWAHAGCDLKKVGRSCRDSVSCSAWRVAEKEV